MSNWATTEELAWLSETAHIALMVLDEQPNAEQIEILRRMTPEQRWNAAHPEITWDLPPAQSGLFYKVSDPDWTRNSKFKLIVRRIFQNAQNLI